MSDFPSLDDFESGTTTVQPRMESVDEDAFSTPFASTKEYPEIGNNGDLLNASEQFQSSFPSLPQSQSQSQSGMISAPTESSIPQDEPDVITQWRARQAEQIQRRDDLSSKRREETTTRARQQIDDFYETYNRKRDARIKLVREEQSALLEKRDESTSGGTTWERVLKLVDAKDVKRGDREVTRMRELLTSLAKDKNAPVAGL